MKFQPVVVELKFQNHSPRYDGSEIDEFERVYNVIMRSQIGYKSDIRVPNWKGEYPPAKLFVIFTNLRLILGGLAGGQVPSTKIGRSRLYQVG